MTTNPLVVIGDSILDVDVDGSASRLSPEAPVPVVEPDRIWHRPGGAGLAAVLAARVHSNVVLITATADDTAGRSMAALLASEYPEIRLCPLPLNGTTVSKIRIRAGGQSVVRVDHGDGTAARGALPDDVVDVLRTAGAICVADYGRGVAGNPHVREAMTARADDTPVVWDPHPRGAQPVDGCALAAPNGSEAQHFAPKTAHADLARVLRGQWRARAVSVTLGSRGALFCDDHGVEHVPVPATAGTGRPDTCGAGDRYAVAAAMAFADGKNALAATRAAVEAASRFVATGGAAAVSSAMAMPSDVALAASRAAVTGMPAVLALTERVRRRGGTVVATGGCFDLLHTGHIRLLRRARELGDVLVVLVNSDSSVRALKGSRRPVVAEDDRARVLGALACVDGVVVFGEAVPSAALEKLRPDVWVKGRDYGGMELPEAEVVRRHGGQIVLLPTVPGYSSSKLIAAAQPQQ